MDVAPGTTQMTEEALQNGLESAQRSQVQSKMATDIESQLEDISAAALRTGLESAQRSEMQSRAERNSEYSEVILCFYQKFSKKII